METSTTNIGSPPRQNSLEQMEEPPDPPGAPILRRARTVDHHVPLLRRRDIIRDQLLSRMRERNRSTPNNQSNRDVETSIAVDALIDFFDDIGVQSGVHSGVQSGVQASRNLSALMTTIEAYTPADPIPYPETMDAIDQPEPVASTEEHSAVCAVIDACDEYNGTLDVAPDPSFLCPISHSALRAPVFAPDGYTYEKTYIDATKKAALIRCVPWCSPMTRARWAVNTAPFPASTSTILAMKFWVQVKAIELAGAKPTDSVTRCASLLQEAL